MLLAHDSRIEKELTETREENGLTIMGLATLQGNTNHIYIVCMHVTV